MDPKEIQAESWMEKTVEPTSAWKREKRLKAVGAVAGVVLLAAVLAMLFRPKAPTVLIIEEGALENARFVPAASQPEPEPLLYMALKQTLLSGNGIYTFPASTPVTIGAQSAREIRRVQIRIGSGSIQTLAGTMVQTVFPDDAPTGALIPVSIRGEKRNGGTTEWKTYAVMLCPEPEGDAPFALCVGGKWVPAGRAVEAEEGRRSACWAPATGSIRWSTRSIQAARPSWSGESFPNIWSFRRAVRGGIPSACGASPPRVKRRIGSAGP